MKKQEELANRVRKIIKENRYLTMSTCKDNTPWIAPLAFYVEEDYSFVYYSSQEARHSVDIESNNIVACSIYDSSLPTDDVDGIQFIGEVTVVPNDELIEIVPKYFLQSFPLEKIRLAWKQPISNFKGLAVKRFYRIKLLEMFAIDLESTQVDKRIELDLDILKNKPMVK